MMTPEEELKNPTCNSGHSDYPLRLWDCPVCVEIERRRLETIAEDKMTKLKGALLLLGNERNKVDLLEDVVEAAISYRECHWIPETRIRLDTALAKLKKEGAIVK